MKIWAVIILLLSCIVGFAASYGYAYKKVNGILYSTGEMQTSTSFSIHK